MRNGKSFGLAVAMMLAVGAIHVRAEYMVSTELWEPRFPDFNSYINLRSNDNELKGVTIYGKSSTAYLSSADVLVATYEGGMSNFALSEGGSVMNAPYALRVHLKDADSGQAGSLTFQGTISAQVGGSADWPILTNVSGTFSTPTQSIQLGANLYEVSLPPVFINSPPAGYVEVGDITAHIAVNPLRPVDAPAPSSLALVGAAFGAIALIRRRPATRS